MIKVCLDKTEIIDILKEHLKGKGLDVIKTNICGVGEVEFEVEIRPTVTPILYPEGVRTNRGILDSPHITSTFKPDQL